MKRILTIVLCILMLLGLCACGGEGKAENGGDAAAVTSFSVGYAKVDITPKGSVPLRGYGDAAERFSNQVMDKLYATCVSFADTEGNKLLLFGLDMLYCDEVLTAKVRQRIADETGLPFDHVLFSADHSHTAVAQNMSAVPVVSQYNEEFSDACLKIAKEALADLKPAQMYGTFTRPEKLTYVRHYVLSDGTYQAKSVGVLPGDQIYGHMWKADNLMQLVKFVREGGKDVLLVNWQSHYYSAAQINYNGISADYYGVLRDELDSALDCHTAFVLGGAGNLEARSYIAGETPASNYIEHGKLLAAEAIKVKDTFQPLETGNIIVNEKMFVAEGTIKENPVYTWGFGDFGMAMAPFEIFDIHAKGVREGSKYLYTFYASCANTNDGYLPNAESFDYYCYEAGITNYPRGTAEQLQEQLTTMINDCFTQSGQTAKERPEGYVVEDKPSTDGLTYLNPSVGDQSKIVDGANKHCVLLLIPEGTAGKKLVIENRELAEKIVALPEMKLLFDGRNIVVGIAE